MNLKHGATILGAILLNQLAVVTTHAALAFSHHVVNREPIYSSGGGLADNFVLTLGVNNITGVRFWGCYGVQASPANDQFTIRFYVDDGQNRPQTTAFFTSPVLGATRNATPYLTWPGDAVFQYDVVLPQALSLQTGTRYYISISSSYWAWGWSGGGPGQYNPLLLRYDGNFWSRQTSGSTWADTHASHDLSFELFGTVPEPSTMIAGALLLLPLSLGVARRLRKRFCH